MRLAKKENIMKALKKFVGLVVLSLVVLAAGSSVRESEFEDYIISVRMDYCSNIEGGKPIRK